MLIDAHCHLGTYMKHYPITDKTIDQMIEGLDRCGVDKMGVSHYEGLHYDFVEGNYELKKAYDKYPDRVIPYFVVNPRYTALSYEEIKKCSEDWGFKALKLHPQFQEYYINSDPPKRIVQRAANYKLIIITHTGDAYAGSFATPYMFADLASEFPELKFIMCHMGVTDWPDAVAVAKANKNIILDTTGATINYGMIEIAASEIGADRIIWGSDYSMYPIELGLSKIIDSELDEESKQQILYKNMIRLFNL
ncbi:MAG: amidohydrolase family protein [Actinobacteria bacterium]|nr:amidohydrolase family protein [Actinomycetota bacterium]